MITKPKLVYDATTPEDGDSVASFLHGSGGALTSTTVGGSEALDINVTNASLDINVTNASLDVNVTNDIDVDIDGVYDAGDNAAPDSAGVIAHERAAAPDETNQGFRSTGGAASSDAVVAANVHGLDVNAFGMGFNGTTWDRLRSGDGQLEVRPFGNVADDAEDSGNPLKVGSRAHDGALTAVADGDRADLLSDLYRRVWVNTAPNISGSNAAVSVDTTAGGVALFASPLAGRRKVIVQNMGNKAIILGFGTVTASNGVLVPAKAVWTDELGPNIDLKAIAESGTQDVRVLQLA